MNNVKLIVSDLDGTLLSPDHKLNPDLQYVIKKFRDAGGLFTIATGRPYITALPFIKQLDIDIPVILCNGAVITQQDRVITKHSFQLRTMEPIIIDAYLKGVAVFMFSYSDVYVFKHSEETKRYEQKEQVACKLLHIDDPIWQDIVVEKIILIGSIELSRSIWSKHFTSVGKAFEAFQSEFNYLEIIDRTCSKGNAIKQIADSLQIDKPHIMSIGNEMNDLTMFEASQIGVAVANANQHLKLAANYICKQAYGDGVIEAIQLAIGTLSYQKRG